jgi:hypothetical protein
VPPPPATSAQGKHLELHHLLVPPEGAYLSPEGLDAWARDTNGSPFSQETKEELVEFLDVTPAGELTSVLPCLSLSDMPQQGLLTLTGFCRFKGFLQLYQLQTENDEEETWRDLVRLTGLIYHTCNRRGCADCGLTRSRIMALIGC